MTTLATSNPTVTVQGPLTTTGATGIIGQPAQATTTTMTPTKLGDPSKWTTTPDQTVAGQIQNLTDPNSPLIQQARSRATQQANARGLINSSMALTGADSAAYDAAMPIAQADAAQASKVAGYNVDTANQFKVKDADTETQVGLANMGAKNQTSQFNVGQTNQALTQERQQGFDLAKMSAQQQNDMAQLAAKQGYNLETITATQAADLQKLAVQIEAQDRQAEAKFGYDKQLVEIQKASNREIAGIEAQYKNLTQASASASSIMNNLATNVSRIMENTSLDATAKQKAIDIYNANATKALQLIGAVSGDLELASYLDEVLGTTTPAPDTTLPPTTPLPTPTNPDPTPTTPTPTPTNPYNPTPWNGGNSAGAN